MEAIILYMGIKHKEMELNNLSGSMINERENLSREIALLRERYQEAQENY